VKAVEHFVLQYGYLLLFAVVFAEQLGAPVPAIPVLLAMGALIGLGRASFVVAVTLSVLACLIADWLWYELGKRRGVSVLRTLCRISIEPDSCVTAAQTTFENQGARALLIAKFVPGLSTMAPPMAGVSGMTTGTFVVLDVLGSLAWSAVFLYVGWAFRTQLEEVALWAQRFGAGFAFFVAALLAAYIGWKYYNRRKFMRHLRVARITPEELMRKIESGEEIVIVDLRNAVEQQGSRLPGALLLRPNELTTRHEEIPRDRDVILYCT
jgi:membrane protein DedA with SNARE-associated domain